MKLFIANGHLIDPAAPENTGMSVLIEDGRVSAAGPPEAGRRGYWLVAPLPQWRQKKVKALVAFLMGD